MQHSSIVSPTMFHSWRVFLPRHEAPSFIETSLPRGTEQLNIADPGLPALLDKPLQYFRSHSPPLIRGVRDKIVDHRMQDSVRENAAESNEPVTVVGRHDETAPAHGGGKISGRDLIFPIPTRCVEQSPQRICRHGLRCIMYWHGHSSVVRSGTGCNRPLDVLISRAKLPFA